MNTNEPREYPHNIPYEKKFELIEIDLDDGSPTLKQMRDRYERQAKAQAITLKAYPFSAPSVPPTNGDIRHIKNWRPNPFIPTPHNDTPDND